MGASMAQITTAEAGGIASIVSSVFHGATDSSGAAQGESCGAYGALVIRFGQPRCLGCWDSEPCAPCSQNLDEHRQGVCFQSPVFVRRVLDSMGWQFTPYYN
jgi:hypothetical protein